MPKYVFPQHRKEPMEGQIEGYWDVYDGFTVPDAPPDWALKRGWSSAILPGRYANMLGVFWALDLAPPDSIWHVISRAGRWTYAHTAGLLRREPYRFHTWDEDGGRRIYSATLAPDIAVNEIPGLYPTAKRFRTDGPSVHLRLERVVGL